MSSSHVLANPARAADDVHDPATPPALRRCVRRSATAHNAASTAGYENSRASPPSTTVTAAQAGDEDVVACARTVHAIRPGRVLAGTRALSSRWPITRRGRRQRRPGVERRSWNTQPPSLQRTQGGSPTTQFISVTRSGSLTTASWSSSVTAICCGSHEAPVCRSLPSVAHVAKVRVTPTRGTQGCPAGSAGGSTLTPLGFRLQRWRV